jgi:hypothetical protein
MGRLSGTLLAVVIAASAVTAPNAFALDLPPGNDNFALRQHLDPGLPLAVSGTTVGATHEGNEPQHGGTSNAPSVWYEWTPSQDMRVRLGACDNYSLLAMVYTGSSLGSLSYVPTTGYCRTIFNAVAGTSYKIVVFENTLTNGSYESPFTLKIRPLEPPANDDVVNAEPLTGSLPILATGTTLDATVEDQEPSHSGWGGGSDRSVWYTWTAPSDTTLQVDACDGDTVGIVAVYEGLSDGTFHNYYRVASSEFECWTDFDAYKGYTYFIVVDGVYRGEGDFELYLDGDNPPPDSGPTDPPATATPGPAAAGTPISQGGYSPPAGRSRRATCAKAKKRKHRRCAKR